jgi:hypothetical protein
MGLVQMRSINRFFSQLDRLALSLKPGETPDRQAASRLCAEFSSLAAPVIGREAAADLFYRALERGRPDKALSKLGAMAAFFAEEFEDTQSLDEEDLEDIRQTLEEVSGDINLDTLTTLMGELLARGKL